MNGPPQKVFRPGPTPRQLEPHDGVLVVDKPSGPTSHDVVDAIRRQFRFDKVGHGGTLDPQATGVLMILIGRGTKLSNQFISSDKTYLGTLRLGIVTDSQDADGKILREADPSGVTREQLEAALAKFRGDIYQTPPMVSAVKIDGVPLYKRARRGQVVEREARLIHVYEFSLRSFELPRAEFTLRCTKGVYVRTLCHEVGELLGCGGHLEQLRRVRAGDMTVEQSIPLDRVLAMSLDELIRNIIPMHKLAVRNPGG